MQKNLNIMKRNVCGTIAEVFFPIILMILVLVIRKAFYFDEEEGDDPTFTLKRSLAFIDFSEGTFKDNETVDGKTISYKYNDDNLWEGQNTALNKIFDICVNKDGKERYLIAIVNVPDEIKNKLKEIGEHSDLKFGMNEDSFKTFGSVDEMKNYVEENSYGTDEAPKLCFGISFQKIESKSYEYHLHYFADYSEEGYQDIPMVSQDVYDPFRNGPNLDSYEKWYSSGFMYIQKIISDYILQKELKEKGTISDEIIKKAKIDFVMRPQKYDVYKEDIFGLFSSIFHSYSIYVSFMFICFKNGK